MILEAGATHCYVDYDPSFGRGPFGHCICTAVDDAVPHGLPHDHALQDGDLLTLDLAVVLDGVAADAAIGFNVGDTAAPASVALITATERALAAGIAAADAGYFINVEFGGGMASDRPCTRIRTWPTTDARVAATGCAPDSCWHSSPGS
jgi:methionine aminopeptidase